MYPKLTISAVVVMFGAAASAAPTLAPYAMSATHEDFLAQLEDAAAAPGEIGFAARAAADLMGPRVEAEHRFVLPVLGFAEAAAGATPAASPVAPIDAVNLEAEISTLLDNTAIVVSALVDLYAAAEEEDNPEVSRLAQRIIWHEMTDAEVLYPAALLVGESTSAN